MTKPVTAISYPNTSENPTTFIVGDNCDVITRDSKPGEMALVGRFYIFKSGEIIAEIKESICNIYYI